MSSHRFIPPVTSPEAHGLFVPDSRGSEAREAFYRGRDGSRTQSAVTSSDPEIHSVFQKLAPVSYMFQTNAHHVAHLGYAREKKLLPVRLEDYRVPDCRRTCPQYPHPSARGH